jgi:hypothetical protein
MPVPTRTQGSTRATQENPQFATSREAATACRPAPAHPFTDGRRQRTCPATSTSASTPPAPRAAARPPRPLRRHCGSPGRCFRRRRRQCRCLCAGWVGEWQIATARRLGKRGAASRRSCVSSRRLCRAHNSAIVGGHGQAVDAATANVAKQESQASGKQQRDVQRRPRAVRLAHRPGDAAVPPARRDSSVRGVAVAPSREAARSHSREAGPRRRRCGTGPLARFRLCAQSWRSICRS